MLLSLYFTPIVRKAAVKYGVMDIPNTKLKNHKEPTPYLGGVSMYLAFLFALALTNEGQFPPKITGILLSASIIVMLGLFDDLKVLSPKVKLFGQAVAVLVLVKAGIMVQLSFIPGWANLMLTFFWVIGITNALNLIDVSDGLAAGITAIAGIFLYIIALMRTPDVIPMLILPLVGSAVGFLAFNRPPAKIYMGDTGSMFLGFMLGAIAMIGKYTDGHHRIAWIAPIIILGIPIFDTLYVMTVRFIRKIPVMSGSPDHFAVRMRNNGFSAVSIAATAYGFGIFLGLSGLAVCYFERSVAVSVAGVIVFVVILVTFMLKKLGRGPAHSGTP
ncbi:MAG: MraY family glycosyltransferase [Myxococcota bacterium]|nr:MraY family glycosyltransferase [Myxococcota bacterium]